MSFGKGLTLYHTIQTFNDPEKKGLLKILRDKEKMLEESIKFVVGERDLNL